MTLLDDAILAVAIVALVGFAKNHVSLPPLLPLSPPLPRQALHYNFGPHFQMFIEVLWDKAFGHPRCFLTFQVMLCFNGGICASAASKISCGSFWLSMYSIFVGCAIWQRPWIS
ncbi:hypothetical protein Nepgr_008689 [Nepenthes gracilis]|uniref:Uncharacterized protein n=1 Tax=Nepenthes gracilis TaxID=150966 RepID=A0AAD3S9W2_NEPGR|nr:hypothetical protein Nepgr_008689 [Nepenthes gracilis]